MTNGEEQPIKGHVVRHLGQLEPEGRMAQVLVSVSDPLGRESTSSNQPPLSLNSYVRAELNAGTLDQAVMIPRRGLRENDEVWVVDTNDELQVREARVLWRQGESLTLSNTFSEGDRIVVSPLQDALPGMKVRPTNLEENSVN